jgi:SAM-dependent methyltransferase
MLIAPQAIKGVLNLGCGNKHRAGAVNVDVTATTSPDVVHDLNVIPWPFPDNQFTEIHAYDVIERLADIPAVMTEIHRIARPCGKVLITVPHFSCANAFTDPTHRHYFGLFSFDYFIEGHELSFYSAARFRMLSRRLIFTPSLVNKAVWRLANRFPRRYEQRWAWIFPAWYLSFDLQVVKASAA